MLECQAHLVHAFSCIISASKFYSLAIDELNIKIPHIGTLKLVAKRILKNDILILKFFLKFYSSAMMN